MNFISTVKMGRHGKEVDKWRQTAKANATFPLSKIPRAVKFLLVVLLVCCVLYSLTYSKTMHWHLSAIARIILIKLVPIWNWPALKNEQCLIPNYFNRPQVPEVNFNCDVCETLDRVDVHDKLDREMLKQRYVDVNVPVILRENPRWDNATNIPQSMTLNRRLVASLPCNVGSNVYEGASGATVGRLLKRARLFERFFLHFQNCDRIAMKMFRTLAPRPKFLPYDLSPVQFNWLLWSRHYNMTVYKVLDMSQPVGVLVQILGNSIVRLVPHVTCQNQCPDIEVMLKAGETLVFGALWDFQYRTDGSDQTLAVLLELH